MKVLRALGALGLFLLATLALLALPFVLTGGDAQRHTGVPDIGMPWQIEPVDGGFSRVFGVEIGRMPFGEARERLGGGAPVVALVGAVGGAGSLEAFYESFSAGLLSGKLVLTLATTLEERERMLQRAVKAEYMEGATRRIQLAAEDLAWSDTRPVIAMAFIPAVNLDEQIVLQRFGTPAERIREGEHREHFLYPDKGLDLQLDAKGREVLQYVAPKDFERLLRAPLRARP